MRPSYIVFDEPSSMLDGHGRAEVMAVIAQLHAAGTGILHITHDLGECSAADRVLMLDAGHLVFEGTPSELLADPAQMESRGLSVPPLLRLAMRLRGEGVDLPEGPFGPAVLAGAVVAKVEAGS